MKHESMKEERMEDAKKKHEGRMEHHGKKKHEGKMKHHPGKK